MIEVAFIGSHCGEDVQSEGSSGTYSAPFPDLAEKCPSQIHSRVPIGPHQEEPLQWIPSGLTSLASATIVYLSSHRKELPHLHARQELRKLSLPSLFSLEYLIGLFDLDPLGRGY